MLHVRFARLPIAMAMLLLASAGPKAADTAPPAEGKATAEAPAPARKVLVVARVQQEDRRRHLEEQTRTELKEKGVEATLGSDVLSDADFATEETIRKKVESLGVDGVIGFVVLGVQESVKQTSASLSIGFGGYGGGGMGMFVGGTVPLGGSTTIIHNVQVRARYFAKPFAGAAWEKIYKDKVVDDVTPLINRLASDSVKNLKKKKLIPAK
ncbi:MAG TPA: hypothetical protein VJV75_12470 [Candidatus Polarisedimenticolia bacterium]|nr:hypothetical protein [Candidatus Polarisedimenticolia bacterium]